jgi:hypothetical protein
MMMKMRPARVPENNLCGGTFPPSLAGRVDFLSRFPATLWLAYIHRRFATSAHSREIALSLGF